MNELQYICPNKKCGRLVLEGSDQVLKLGDRLNCPHCKEDGIIEEMTYRLNVGTLPMKTDLLYKVKKKK